MLFLHEVARAAGTRLFTYSVAATHALWTLAVFIHLLIHSYYYHLHTYTLIVPTCKLYTFIQFILMSLDVVFWLRLYSIHYPYFCITYWLAYLHEYFQWLSKLKCLANVLRTNENYNIFIQAYQRRKFFT